MIDPRFYEISGPLTAADIAGLTGATVLRGDATRQIGGLAAAASAGAGDLTFVEDPRGGPSAASAGICLATAEAAEAIPAGPVVLVTRHPRAAFARIGEKMIRLRELEPGPAVHPEARIAPTARLEPGAVIGRGAAIGPEARICANAVIGPGVQIGARTVINANAVVKYALLGDGVRIMSGAVVGESGFGLNAGAAGIALTPHYGRVIIQNGASLGASSCIDRGMLGDTVIGENTHIDNMCHIGHNCHVGANVVMAAYAGVSGSCVIGDGVQFGGRVGVKDHLRIGNGARIGAGGALLTDVPPGETYGGYPAKPIKTWLRELAWVSREAQKQRKSGNTNDGQ